ncbi:2TM domain-containing protein [Herbidospora mongoliensis]|uniref:2TM domain-containing protein n=1 Tax=Herbidospora mongoliensis TaxID=688067 RepID=UPI00082C80D8|nr:2TM domain-containing protein [Herbidospora mongoliensis]
MNYKKSEAAKAWGLRIHLFCYLAANLAQVIVWYLYDSDNFFWPMWSIVFWGIGAAFHVWAVYSPPKSRVE